MHNTTQAITSSVRQHMFIAHAKSGFDIFSALYGVAKKNKLLERGDWDIFDAFQRLILVMVLCMVFRCMQFSIQTEICAVLCRR